VKRVGFSALLSAFLLLSAAGPGWTQLGVTVLSPLQEQYRIGGFDYRPPAGDGWRETGKTDNELRLVFAVQLPDSTSVDMRAEFIAHAFAVEDANLVADASELASKSLEQQSARRRGTLVALTRVESVAEAEGVYAFTLVSRGNGQDYFERFYVALAPDRSEYISAKLTTKDTDLDKTPYLGPLQSSLASLTHDSARVAAGEGPKADAPNEKESQPSAGSVGQDTGGLATP